MSWWLLLGWLLLGWSVFALGLAVLVGAAIRGRDVRGDRDVPQAVEGTEPSPVQAASHRETAAAA